MPRELWDELGGFDEDFASPASGLVNLDFFDRAVSAPSVEVVGLLGEGSFHQVHGGFSSNAAVSRWPEMHDEYVRIKGHEYRAPECPISYFGAVPDRARTWLMRSQEGRLGEPDPERWPGDTVR